MAVSATTFKSIIDDQHTAARAYFLCVIGLVLIETLIQLPGLLRQLFPQSKLFSRTKASHIVPRVYLHKFLTLPSPLPILTNHHLANLLRLAIFIGLNILFGWSRIRFTTDYKLYGWLTIANGGLALLFASRANLFSVVLRVPSSALLVYHRWAGRAALVHATLHFALTADHHQRTRQLAVVLTNGYIQAGIVSFSALTLVGLTSIGPIRRRFFEAFYYPHFLFLVFLIAAIVHASPAPEFLLPGFGLWAADRAWRFFKTLQPIAIKSANIYPGDLLKLQVEGVQPSRPNQIAWLGTSATSYLNGHPYTIASAPGSGTGTFAIRGLGGHTRKLHSLVSGTKEVDASGMTVVGHSLRLRVDGPHGHGSLQWEQYPVVVLLAGGVGITPSISIASYILRGASTPSVSVTTKHIHLMWSVRDLRHTSWFEDELSALSGLAGSGTSGVTFDVSICVSGSSVARVPAQSVYEQSYAMEEPHTYKGPGVVHKGRPDIRHWFTYIKAAHPESDVAVSLCGPRALIADGRRAAVKVSDKGGLFHVEEEVFER